MFGGERARSTASVADARWAAVAERLTTPVRVTVSGRRGVGRSTVAHALVRAGIEVAPVDAAELLVYVIAEVVKPEDSDAVASSRHPVLAVLNKADLARGPLPVLGVPVEPMVGMLAVAAFDDSLDDTLWAALGVLSAQPADLSSPDGFVAGAHPVAAEVRRRLVDTLDVFGITAAVAAIRQGTPAPKVGELLRRLSRIDPVVEQIRAAGAEVRYRRILDAVIELEVLAVTDRRAAELLSADDTVNARMAAAVDVVEAAGLHVERCDNPAAYLRRAAHWRRYGRGPVAELHRACGADIVRGSVRLWSKTGVEEWRR
jgi:hypothetical protein